MSIRTRWASASTVARIIVGVVVAVAVGLAAWWLVSTVLRVFGGGIAEKTQKVERTVAGAQSTTDAEIHTREKETIIREPVIIRQTEIRAERVVAAPAGQQLGPMLDELCGMRLYSGDPGCADRLPDPGAGEEVVPGGAAPEQ